MVGKRKKEKEKVQAEIIKATGGWREREREESKH